MRGSADSSEAEVNKPLLYDRGWGKMQAYCLAFGASGAEDVTKVYVDDWRACMTRRWDKRSQGTGWSEKRLRWVSVVTETEEREGQRRGNGSGRYRERRKAGMARAGRVEPRQRGLVNLVDIKPTLTQAPPPTHGSMPRPPRRRGTPPPAKYGRGAGALGR